MTSEDPNNPDLMQQLAAKLIEVGMTDEQEAHAWAEQFVEHASTAAAAFILREIETQPDMDRKRIVAGLRTIVSSWMEGRS
jgi:hypothetical protein